MDALRTAADLIAGAERLVVLTGAGMSAESGVPTFRDALTGLWARYDAQTLATPEAFDSDPALVWGWNEWRRELVERVHPHAGHAAIARRDCTLITQNVDDLHERAAAADADVLIIVGTSGRVHPAAEIPRVTAKMGGAVIQVDPRPTPLDPFCAVNLRGTAAGVLPEIIR